MMRAVPGDADLYRWIHPSWILSNRISSAAFNDEEMSCDDGSLCPPEDTHARRDSGRGGGVGRFTADFARGEEQAVLPSPELGNPAHVTVEGKKPKARRKRFAEEAWERGWAVAPTAPPSV